MLPVATYDQFPKERVQCQGIRHIDGMLEISVAITYQETFGGVSGSMLQELATDLASEQPHKFNESLFLKTCK